MIVSRSFGCIEARRFRCCSGSSPSLFCVLFVLFGFPAVLGNRAIHVFTHTRTHAHAISTMFGTRRDSGWRFVPTVFPFSALRGICFQDRLRSSRVCVRRAFFVLVGVVATHTFSRVGGRCVFNGVFPHILEVGIFVTHVIGGQCDRSFFETHL